MNLFLKVSFIFLLILNRTSEEMYNKNSRRNKLKINGSRSPSVNLLPPLNSWHIWSKNFYSIHWRMIPQKSERLREIKDMSSLLPVHEFGTGRHHTAHIYCLKRNWIA